MKDQLKLNMKSLENAGVRVGFEFEKDTKTTIKQNNIWDTGDTWGSVTADGKAEIKGDTIITTVRTLESKLKKRRSAKTGYKRTIKSNYTKFVHDGTKFMKARPFFDWTLKANNSKYNKIIMDAYKVDVV